MKKMVLVFLLVCSLNQNSLAREMTGKPFAGETEKEISVTFLRKINNNLSILANEVDRLLLAETNKKGVKLCPEKIELIRWTTKKIGASIVFLNKELNKNKNINIDMNGMEKIYRSQLGVAFVLNKIVSFLQIISSFDEHLDFWKEEMRKEAKKNAPR